MKTIFATIVLSTSLQAFSATVLSVPQFTGAVPVHRNVIEAMDVSRVTVIAGIEYERCLFCDRKVETKSEDLKFDLRDGVFSFELENDFQLQGHSGRKFKNCFVNLFIEGEREYLDPLVTESRLFSSTNERDCRSSEKVRQSIQYSLRFHLDRGLFKEKNKNLYWVEDSSQSHLFKGKK